MIFSNLPYSLPNKAERLILLPDDQPAYVDA
ncbi:hypothetical protein PAAL109150_18640 [Paenibacillus alkaliterrae]